MKIKKNQKIENNFNFARLEKKIYTSWEKFFCNDINNVKNWSFKKLLDNHRNISRNKYVSNKGFDNIIKTESKFCGYNKLKIKAQLCEWYSIDNIFFLIFDKTVFYPKMGGQNSDVGIIYNKDMTFSVEKVYNEKTLDGNNTIIHKCKTNDITKKMGRDFFFLKVNNKKRKMLENNHSGTHILYASIQKILQNNQIKQLGSDIKFKKFTFDCGLESVPEKKKIIDINLLVFEIITREIKSDLKIDHFKNIATNKNIKMHFQDKYNDKVRIVSFGDFSIELCSGTHVKNTANIEAFLIAKVKKISSNVVRFKAITTWNACFLYFCEYFAKINDKFNINNFKIEPFFSLYKDKIQKIYNFQKNNLKYKNFSYFKNHFKDFILSNIIFELFPILEELNYLKKKFKQVTFKKSNIIVPSDLIKEKIKLRTGIKLLFHCFDFKFNPHKLIRKIINIDSELLIFFVFNIDSKYIFIINSLKVNCNKLGKEIISKIGGNGGGNNMFFQGNLIRKIKFNELENFIIKWKN